MVTRVPESTSASGEDRFGVTRTRPSSIGTVGNGAQSGPEYVRNMSGLG